ncbi:MAG: hypothetical protein U0703_27580 [Anaerolineae bacterium]
MPMVAALGHQRRRRGHQQGISRRRARRAAELGVGNRITFVEGDAERYIAEAQGFDVVSCIGGASGMGWWAQ